MAPDVHLEWTPTGWKNIKHGPSRRFAHGVGVICEAPVVVGMKKEGQGVGLHSHQQKQWQCLAFRSRSRKITGIVVKAHKRQCTCAGYGCSADSRLWNVSTEPASATLVGSLFQVGIERYTGENLRQLVGALFSLNLCRWAEWVLPSAASRPRTSGVTTTIPWKILKRRVSLCCSRRSSRVRSSSSFLSCVMLHCWRGERPWHHLMAQFWTCSMAVFCVSKCGSQIVAPYSRQQRMRLMYAIFFSSDGHPLRFRFRNRSFLLALDTASVIWSENSRVRGMMMPRYVAVSTCWRNLSSISYSLDRDCTLAEIVRMWHLSVLKRIPHCNAHVAKLCRSSWNFSWLS